MCATTEITLLNASMQQCILDIKQKTFVNGFLVFSIEGTSVGAPEGYIKFEYFEY